MGLSTSQKCLLLFMYKAELLLLRGKQRMEIGALRGQGTHLVFQYDNFHLILFSLPCINTTLRSVLFFFNLTPNSCLQKYLVPPFLSLLMVCHGSTPYVKLSFLWLSWIPVICLLFSIQNSVDISYLLKTSIIFVLLRFNFFCSFTFILVGFGGEQK